MLLEAAQSLQDAVDQAISEDGIRPADVGGPHGTAAVTRAVISAL